MKAKDITQKYKDNFPKVSRPKEAMAFFYVVFNVAGKPTNSFAAVDQFTQYAIQLDIESSCTDKDILKNVYTFTEHPELNRRNEEPITLVMDGPEHLKDSIEKIIAPGKVIFNSAYRKYISLEFVEAMAGIMKGNLSRN